MTSSGIFWRRAIVTLSGCLLVCGGIAVHAQSIGTPAPGGDGRQHLIRKLELKQTPVVDAARLISELSGLNIVATTEAGSQEVTLFLQDVTAIDAIEALAKISGLWYREDEKTGMIRLMTTEQYQKDLIVFREDDTRVFTLLHPNSISVAQAIQDLYGSRVVLSVRSSNDDDQLQAASFGGQFGSGSGGGNANQGLSAGQSFGTSTGTGLFGRTGEVAGSGRFSRPAGTFGGFGSGNRVLEDMAVRSRIGTDAMTPERIALIERLLGERGDQTTESDAAQDDGLPSEILNELLRREPPIFVTTNRQHNLVIVRTSDPDAMRAIEQLVMEIDRPTPEVLLEMKILEVRLDDNFRSIFDMDFLTGPDSSGPATVQPRNPLLPGATSATQTVLGLGNFALESGNTLVYQFLDGHIRARVQLLETQDRVTLVATPLLMASNNRPARIFVGEERVLTTGVSTSVVTPDNGATTTAVEPVTEIRDIGTTLLILPKIDADRTVTLFISQDSSNVSEDSAVIPVAGENGGVSGFDVDTINTANIQGTVVARDGLTVAIGGLIREDTTEFVEKIPVLGDMKGVGFLFRKETRRRFKSELVLLITPHIITTPLEGACKSESRLRHLSSHPHVHMNSFQGSAPPMMYESMVPAPTGPYRELMPVPGDTPPSLPAPVPEIPLRPAD